MAEKSQPEEKAEEKKEEASTDQKKYDGGAIPGKKAKKD